MLNPKVIPVTAMGHAGDGKVHVLRSTKDIYWINEDIEIVIEENVSVSFLDTTTQKKVDIFAASNSHIRYMVLDSKDSWRNFHIQGELQYTEIVLQKTKETFHVGLYKEGAEAVIKCLCIASGMKSEFSQKIIHESKNTTSSITNVGVSMENSKIAFDTTGQILKGMSASKCQQLSRGIVMDDDSEVTAKPILLIDEFDCFANHGASIGKMSDEDMFYLMSRGLTKKEAFLLILQGIIQPFLSSIELEDWKNRIDEEVSKLIEK